MPDSRHRILLVDDEPLICKVIQRLLKKQKQFEIHTAINAREALGVFLNKGPFDLLLTDLQLPGVSGTELAKRFLHRDPNLKIVFMSGDVPKEFAATCLAIEKPFSREDLIRILEQALTRGK